MAKKKVTSRKSTLNFKTAKAALKRKESPDSIPVESKGEPGYLSVPMPSPYYLMVQVIEQRKVTEGGIFMPDNAFQEPMPYGRVVAIGSECKLYKEGDYVLMSRMAGQPLVVGKITLLFIRESDVLGTMKWIPDKKNG